MQTHYATHTWQIIKEVAHLDSNKKHSSDLLKLSNCPITAVNTVNSFFAHVDENLAEQIINRSTCNLFSTNSQTPLSHLMSPVNSMALLPVSEEEINATIINLKVNCAVGWDGIPSSIIKAGRHVLTPCLIHVFNLCLCAGIFPRVFKKAVVHPVFKSGDPNSISNYRPISVLTTISKFFE